MDVKYRPNQWDSSKVGLNRLDKARDSLLEANKLLSDISSTIEDLDADHSIYFNHKNKQRDITKLFDDYKVLERYSHNAGNLVNEHIDKPAVTKLDEFAQRMESLSIRKFSTKNTIGVTTEVSSINSSGYGTQSMTVKKDKITVDDLFKDVKAFNDVLTEEYQNYKKQFPNEKLSYEAFRELSLSPRLFNYISIEDEQKQIESWRDGITSALVLIGTIACPEVGFGIAFVNGVMQTKSSFTGEDWATQRKLSDEERSGKAFWGALDMVSGIGAARNAFKANQTLSFIKLGKNGELTKVDQTTLKHIVESLQKDRHTFTNRLKMDSYELALNINKLEHKGMQKLAKSLDELTSPVLVNGIDDAGFMSRNGAHFEDLINNNYLQNELVLQNKLDDAYWFASNGISSKIARSTPGTATTSFNLQRSLESQKKLMYNEGSIGIIPLEVREKLAGREFKNFDHFREELWKAVADSSYASEFSPWNLVGMKKGFAPFAPASQYHGKHRVYILHHKQPIHQGGDVYDLDNLIIVSPKMHQQILDPAYHFGKKG
ncbi:hypothetical protein [Bacillus toyonensis]|uniref:hypothetical protein n=1 Tax=Bacillus toyonensis TaxID=155322 RepID=UPI002E1D9880|nr:hypothetical protein [Bacillus toyonensis]